MVESSASKALPVLIWIHGKSQLNLLCSSPLKFYSHPIGGSQTVTFGSSSQGLCGRCAPHYLQNPCSLIATDPTNLVRKSIELGQPMIVVTLNYRLNMFAFGDGNGEKNLALSDQRAALHFVRQHIGGFGGDPVTHTLRYYVSMADGD